jgi:hypothetical protein
MWTSQHLGIASCQQDDIHERARQHEAEGRAKRKKKGRKCVNPLSKHILDFALAKGFWFSRSPSTYFSHEKE